jgi:tetratricopeptide (TPR) repeat protein
LACLLAAEELQSPSIIARSHNLLGNIDRSRGRIRESAAHIEESLKIYHEIGDLQGQAIAQNSLGNAYFDLGQWNEADRFYRQAGLTLSHLGNIYNRVFVDNNLGGIALNQGRLDDALLYYRRALSSLELISGSPWVRGVIHLNLGATYTRRGELALAFEHLNNSRELFAQAKNRDLLPELHRRLAEAYLADTDRPRARQEGLAALTQAEEQGVISEQGLARRVIGEIDAAEGDYKSAEANFLKAIELLQGIGDNYGLACTQLALAEIYSRSQQYEQRDALLHECIPVFDRLGATIEQKRARLLQNPSSA